VGNLDGIESGFIKIRDIKGEKNPTAVFTECLVRDIKYGAYSGMSSREIADITGKNYEAIRRIKTGQHWKNV
jgi:hypothetical protein